MKQKDIALIAVVVVISAIFSLIISNMIFASPKNRKEQVEVVVPIKTELASPDERYFNDSAIDPTQTITIGENANSDPFNGSQ